MPKLYARSNAWKPEYTNPIMFTTRQYLHIKTRYMFNIHQIIQSQTEHNRLKILVWLIQTNLGLMRVMMIIARKNSDEIILRIHVLSRDYRCIATVDCLGILGREKDLYIDIDRYTHTYIYSKQERSICSERARTQWQSFFNIEIEYITDWQLNMI